MLVGSFGARTNSMKRPLEEASAVESSSKKSKTQASKSLFDHFEEGNLQEFEQEVKNHALCYKHSLDEKDRSGFLEEKNSSGDTILFVVGESNKEDADQYFKVLMNNGVNINSRHPLSGITELSSACVDQNFDRMARALSYSADANVVSIHGVVPLHYFLHIDFSDFSAEQQDVLFALYAKTDPNHKNSYGDTFMHSRLLEKQAAVRLSLYGGDVDTLNEAGRKPFETCWDIETYKSLKSRSANRKNAIMPVVKEVAKSQDFKHKDNVPGMPNSVPKLIFNRGINGPRELNLNRLILKHREINEPKDV